MFASRNPLGLLCFLLARAEQGVRGVQEVTRGLSTCVPPFTKQSREGRGEGREGCVLLLCVVISGAQLPVGPHCKVPDNDLLHVSKSLVSSQVPVGATVSFYMPPGLGFGLFTTFIVDMATGRIQCSSGSRHFEISHM